MPLILAVLLGLHVALMALAPILSAKIVLIGLLAFPAGQLVVGAANGLLDVINDRWGRSEARASVVTALVVRLALYLILIPLLVALPGHSPDGYDAILGQSVRLFAAGELGVFIESWLVSTSVFTWLRARTLGRWFALRYLTATGLGTVVGTTVFVAAGYALTGAPILPLIAGGVTVRLLLLIVLAPAFTGLRRVVGRLTHG